MALDVRRSSDQTDAEQGYRDAFGDYGVSTCRGDAELCLPGNGNDSGISNDTSRCPPQWPRPEIGPICGGVTGVTLAHGFDEGPVLSKQSSRLILKTVPQPEMIFP